jgi:hypothetical protein
VSLFSLSLYRVLHRAHCGRFCNMPSPDQHRECALQCLLKRTLGEMPLSAKPPNQEQAAGIKPLLYA